MESLAPRLLLVEDDVRLAPIIVDYLSTSYRVDHVGDGEGGLRAAQSGGYDVIVVDRRLPGIDGVELVTRARAAGLATPILMLTALGTLNDRVSGLDAGANDYLVKPFEFEELEARLRAITRDYSSTPSGLTIGDWSYYPDDRCVYSPYSGPIVLTPRENEVLRLLATSPHRTFSRAEILAAVFSDDDQPGTVDTYVHYLRRKTDDGVVVTVRGRGYRLGTL